MASGRSRRSPRNAIAAARARAGGPVTIRAMEIHFLGGATTVTGSQFLLVTERARVLIDCGMFQGSPNESIRNRVPFDYDPAELDAMLLTHAHLDHCGLLPLLVKDGLQRPDPRDGRDDRARRRSCCWTRASCRRSSPSATRAGSGATPTRPRRRTARRPSQYAAAVALAEAGEDGDAVRPARPASTSRRPSSRSSSRRRPPPGRATRRPSCAPSRRQLEIDLDEPLYTAKDAERVARPVPRRSQYDQEFEVAPGHPRHVPRRGPHPRARRSSVVRVTEREGGEERVIVFSGDLGRPGHADPARPHRDDRRGLRPRRVDVRRPRARAGGARPIRILAETVRLVADADGVLLVPSFAIGRTQEVVWELDRLIERGEIPLLPLYLDSPMASKASDIYRHHPDYYDEETAKLLRDGETPLDYPNQIITNNVKESQAIEQRAAAVHDRGLQRDADRRSRRRPPAQPHRRPDARRSCSSATRARARSARTSRPARRRSSSMARSDASAARSARSAASRPTPTRASCSTGCARFGGRAATRRRRLSARSSSSTATRRPRSRWSRRCATWASRPTSRTGTSASRSTDPPPHHRGAETGPTAWRSFG